MKTLFVLFKNVRLEQSQIEAFRKEILTNTDSRYDLFHNHLPDGKTIYRYPQVQFRSYKGYAALYGIAEGAELIWSLLGSGQLGKKYSSDYEIIENEEFAIRVEDAVYFYSIKNIYPFNTPNYIFYKSLTSLAEKAAFMEKKIGTHLVKFCEEFGIKYTKGEIKVNLIDMQKHPGVDIKDEKMMVFDLVISTNLHLPDFFGLGRYKSHGAGTLKRL